jgi:hypothetical protein
MKNAVIVHGRPSAREYYLRKIIRRPNSTAHWQGWLRAQLIANGYLVDTPKMPRPYQPNYEKWRKEFERCHIGPQTLLIGHSCGGGFLIRWLSEHPEAKVGKVILVAPWIGHDYGAPATDFFDGYKIDPNIASRTKGLVVFYSDNDVKAIQAAISQLKTTLRGAKYKEFHHYGHFTISEMKTSKFPELLEECLK